MKWPLVLTMMAMLLLLLPHQVRIQLLPKSVQAAWICRCLEGGAGSPIAKDWTIPVRRSSLRTRWRPSGASAGLRPARTLRLPPRRPRRRGRPTTTRWPPPPPRLASLTA